MSVFAGPKLGLRSEFRTASTAGASATNVDSSSTSDNTDAVLLHIFSKRMSYWYVNNKTDVPAFIYLVNPDGMDDVAANRLLFIEIPPNTAMNFDPVTSPNLFFDIKTRVYIATPSISTGKFYSLAWG